MKGNGSRSGWNVGRLGRWEGGKRTNLGSPPSSARSCGDSDPSIEGSVGRCTQQTRSQGDAGLIGMNRKECREESRFGGERREGQGSIGCCENRMRYVVGASRGLGGMRGKDQGVDEAGKTEVSISESTGEKAWGRDDC